MKNHQSRIFLLLIACLLIVRVLVHIYFTGVYTDGDQTITWLSAVDKANGNWYTPYFYGQFYNISIEALLAAPLIKFGINVKHAVPIVSNFIGLAPFLFGAWYLKRIKQQSAAMMILCLGLILPAQYHFITAMARGFAGGLAVLSFGVLLTSFKSNVVKTLGYSVAFISYFVNPNVLIIGFPLGLVWLVNWLTDIKQKKTTSLAHIALAAVIAGLTYYGLHANNNPLFEVHKLWKLEVSIDYLTNSFQSLDARFLYLFPFLPKMGSLILLALLILTVLLFVKRRTKHGVLMSVTLLFIIATLSLNKTLDGTYSTFFPFSRMYLALPYVLVLAVSFFINHGLTKRLRNIFMLIGGVGFCYQVYDIPKKATASVQGNSGVVQVIRIDKLCLECEKLHNIQQTYEADVTVFHYKTDEYIYGCKALQPELKTVYPEYDRRYWTFMEHADTVYNTLLFMDWSMKLPELLQSYEGDFNAIDSIHYPAFIMTDNSQSIIDLYTINSLRLRPYKN
ncbi:MAG: hypothetical protein KC517_05615 [Bacteroidetes bacterium]|jgi:hypothetical protein|nr:hypothetical protein [Bacteroidota bacterium]